MNNTVVISCWFGERFSKPQKVKTVGDLVRLTKYKVKSLLPLKLLDLLNMDSVIPEIPKNQKKCLFFTNNKKLKKEIAHRGWEYQYIEKDVDVGESIDSSLHAKVVKFLQLDPSMLSQLFNYQYIVYMDSRRISDNIVQYTAACDKGILIRNTPRLKTSVWDEVEEAKSQERYARSMEATVSFIDRSIEQGYRHNNRVMNTGVIVYKIDDLIIRKSIQALCAEVYNCCIEYDQPECQIFWCILSQKYEEIITKVDFNKIKTRTGY